MGLDAPAIRTKMPILEHRRSDFYSLSSPMNLLLLIDSFDEKEIPWGQIQISVNQIFFRTALTMALVNKKTCFTWTSVVVLRSLIVKRFSQLNPAKINDLFLSTQMISTKIEEFYQGKSLRDRPLKNFFLDFPL